MKVESQAEVDQLVAALGRGLTKTLKEATRPPVDRLVIINNIGPVGWWINEDRFLLGDRVGTRDEARKIVRDYVDEGKGAAGYYEIADGDDKHQVTCGYQIVFPR